MRASSWLTVLLSLVVASTALGQAVRTQEDNPAPRLPPVAGELGDAPRMIVKFRSGAGERVQAQAAGDPIGKLASRMGARIRETRSLPAGLHTLRFEPGPAGQTLAEQLERVRADPGVEWAEPDHRRFAYAVPNDPLYGGQWYMQSLQPSAVNAEAAWDAGGGSAGVVIAVIDTGVLFDHPDLQRAAAGGRLLPGYDFISTGSVANDGGGRDSDATDAGDWITAAENSSGPFNGCGVSDSSWHGTRVAGIIGALANNSQGVTGLTWNPWIVPIRALGKCGGFDSDILDAMAWAAGIHVNGVPDNPHPAKIENLSLGSVGGCPASYQALISQLTARGVLVVAAAGNEGGPVGAPANCLNVAGITGLRHAGTKVGFASLGPQISVGAPGGNCVNVSGGPCLFSIDTTSNLGTTTAGTHTYTNQTNFNVGTSFSAPIVSGIVGLMASVNGNLGTVQLITRLKEGATTPFPVSPDVTIPMCHVPMGPNDLQTSECNCTTSTCGAGMADALGAVTAALRPIAALVAPAVVTPGQSVALSAAGSAAACNRTISTYSWTVEPPGSGLLTGPSNTAAASINAPTSGSVVVRITVTDNLGATDFADVTINPTSTSTGAPANAGNNACPADIPRPPPVNVTVSPTSATLSAGNGIQTFNASVTNAQNTTVTWFVNGAQGGNSTVGTITAGGVYQAPTNVPSPAVVTVTARSVEDPSKSASAQVTIVAPSVSVVVSPPTASVQVSATLTLTATVSGTSNTAVSWRVDGADGGNATVGTVSAFGVYTAPAAVPSPATVTVTAVSVANPGVTSSSQVTVTSMTSPSSGGGGDGGGGGGAALDLLVLLCLLTFVARLSPYRRVDPSR